MLRSLVFALLAVAAIFLIVAFASDLFAERGLQVTHWGNGSVRTRSEALRYPDGRFVLDGHYQAFHESGSPQLEGQYRQGKPHGIWSEWDAQGLLRKKGTYRDGLTDGRWEYWNPGGDPEHETLNWRRGRVMENGEAVSPPPSGPPRYFAWGAHILGYLSMLLLFVGPLPLALWITRNRHSVVDSGSVGDSSEAGGSAENWLVALSAWCLLQLGVALLLASSGMLHAGPLFGFELLLLVSGLMLFRRRWVDLRAFAPRLDDPAAAALALAFLALGLAALEKGLAVPMTDWDGLAYHLPLMAEWIQNGSLVSVPELGQTGRYPSHWELMSLLGYFAFAEDLLFTLPNMIAWLMLGLSVITLARRAGARSTDAAASALLLLSLPVVLMQTEEIKADLPTAAAFGAVLVMGGLFSDSRRGVRPALFVLSLGWLCGLKASGPVYATLALCVVVVWHLAVSRRIAPRSGAGGRRGSSAIRIGVAVVVALALAGFWYLRNFLELGNPLGEVQLQVIGKELFAGELTRAQLQQTTFWSVWRPGDVADWRALLAAAREWMGWIMIPLVGSYLAALVGGWGSRRARWVTGLLLGLVVVCGGLYAITPFSGDNGSNNWRLTSWVGQTWRYALPKFLAAAVLASLGWRVLRIPRGVPVALAVFASAWAAALYVAAPRASLVVAVVAAMAIVTLLSPLRGWLLSRIPLLRVTAPVRVVVLGSLILLAFAGDVFWLHELREHRERKRHELYSLPYSYAVDTSNDAPVGFAMTQLRYPFYGRDLLQPVIDVSCRGCARSSWTRELRERGIKVLALGPAPVVRSFSRPEADLRPWVEAEGASFRAMENVGSGAGEGIVLYEVRTKRLR